jgi:hypothetical protein
VAFSQPSSVVLGLPVDLASLASPLAIDKGGAIKSSGLVHSQQWLVGFGPPLELVVREQRRFFGWRR